MPDANWYLERAKQRLEEKIVEDPEASIDTWLIVRKQDEDSLILFGASPRFLAQISAIAVSGFEADELVFICDSFSAKTETNPEGEKWGQGEMQRRHDEPAVRALLTESLWVSIVKRGDTEVTLFGAPYGRLDGRLVWLETPSSMPVVDGFIPKALLGGVNTKGIRELAAEAKSGVVGKLLLEAAEDLDEKDRWFHQRVGTIKSMIRISRAHDEQLGFAIPGEKDEEAKFMESLREEKGTEVWSTGAKDR